MSTRGRERGRSEKEGNAEGRDGVIMRVKWEKNECK